MNTFFLENPNKKLTNYGLYLIAIFIGAILFEYLGILYKSQGVVIGLAVIVRILVLLWISQAAIIVGRNRFLWTLFAFITPSVAMIILGQLGYIKSSHYYSVIQKNSGEYETMKTKLSSSFERNEISQDEMDLELFNYYLVLADAAKKELTTNYKETDETYLNDQLEKQGYIIDNNSDVFVEYNGKCPACGKQALENEEICSDCGLKLK